MIRPRWIAACVLGVCLGPGAFAEEFASYHENVMGTSMELRIAADDADAARRAEARVLAEIDRLAAIFSNHDDRSEFRRWQADTGGPVAISRELFEVLEAADRWRTLSGGAFEPGVQALGRIWAEAASEDRLPDPGELDGARATLSHPAWRLDPAKGTAERLGDGPLSLDAIAKGFILERACGAALSANDGVRGLFLNVGGDLRAAGEGPRTIAIAAPRPGATAIEPIATVELRDRALATSGGHHRGFAIGGRHYSHILDPRTGRPAEAVALAAVIAARSADADALATTLNVLPIAEGLRLVESIPDVEALIVDPEGRIARTAGWQRFEPVALALAADPPPAPEGWWGNAFELEVEVEVNQPDGGPRYRRPYVAVWVENKEGFPVRTLALWVSLTGGGPSTWLPDLKRWYRGDQARKRSDNREMVLAWAEPTHPAGKYAVIWDGRDDKKRPVPPGEYTIFIEAAREHGTYQSIRQAVTIADAPFAEELPGNVEIRSASIAYRRKAPAAK